MKKTALIIVVFFFSFFIASSKVSAGEFSISPSSGSYARQCDRVFDIFIDTEGVNSNSADLKINYDPSRITIVDADPVRSGTQIIPGDAYQNYIGNSVNTVSGVIRIAGLSLDEDLNGSGLFARVIFQANAAVSDANFTIQFTGVGNTLDSNIAESSTGNDVLDGVTNASFTFTSQNCFDDTTPPTVNFNFPQNHQLNVPTDTNFQFSFQDSSPIDLSTLNIVIYDQVYTINSPEVSYSGISTNYIVQVNPSTNFPAGQEIIVSASVADSFGNVGADSISFNRPVSPGVVTPTPLPPSPLCGEECSETNPCSGGLSCDEGICKILDCIGRQCTCNVTLQACGSECIDDLDCESNLKCYEGICRILGCAQETPENCACTPPQLICVSDGPDIITPINNVINSIRTNPTVTTIVNRVQEVYDTFVPQPIQQIVDEVSAPGFLTGVVSIGLLANILSIIISVRSPQLILLLLGLYFDKQRKPWGIVFDGSKNKPLPFASIRVYLKGTKTLVEQRVTDSEGRYGLILPSGKYRMEIEHPDFHPKAIELQIINDNDIVPNDVELEPKENVKEKKFSLGSLYRGINEFFIEHMSFFVYFGLVTSIIAILISFNVFNLIMLILYGASAIMYKVNTQKSVNRWGQVVDSKNELRIPYAIVKLFDVETWKMIDTQMTNQNGSFGLFNEPGKYAILVSAKGYTFPSKKQKNLKPIPDKFGLLELDIYNKKNLNIILYVDPETGKKRSVIKNDPEPNSIVPKIGVSNLASPFES